ncbi:MAG: HEAT repeat domain-containing protein [Planctomycetes bacterium]|nr:HEAT repeat domain-containing protein [Planctomycetota bacterium]
MDDQPEPLRERNGSTAVALHNEIQKHVQDLYSEDFAIRAESISELEKFGKAAAEAIVNSLITKSPQLNALLSFTKALEEIGKPAVNVIIHALDHIQDVRTPEEVYVLEGFVETLGRLGDRRAVPTLAQQLDKLNAAIARNHNKGLVEACTAAKVRIQLILSELGSKAGLEDLLQMLGDGRRRVRDGVVESLGRIGDRRALIPLVRLYAVEDDVSLANAEDIRDAFRQIMRREHIACDDGVLRELNPEDQVTLEKLLPKARRV